MMSVAISLLRLLLPALFPSWRFFKSIQPSPRVEWRPCRSVGASETVPKTGPEPDSGPPDTAAPDTAAWQPVQPRPQSLRAGAMLRRLFWNPGWNETLYLVSLSERLVGEEAAFCAPELLRRVARALPAGTTAFQARLVFITRATETSGGTGDGPMSGGSRDGQGKEMGKDLGKDRGSGLSKHVLWVSDPQTVAALV